MCRQSTATPTHTGSCRTHAAKQAQYVRLAPAATTKLHTLATIRPTTTKASNRYEYAGNIGQTIIKKNHANKYTVHTAEPYSITLSALLQGPKCYIDEYPAAASGLGSPGGGDRSSRPPAPTTINAA